MPLKIYKYIFSILFISVAFANDCSFDLGELPEVFERLKNSMVTTRTGLQGTLHVDDSSMVFRTADGHSAELIGGTRDGVVKMVFISVDGEIQGHGVQTLLFDRLIQNASDAGEIRYIEISHLVDDNKRAVLMQVANRLGLNIDNTMSTFALENLLLESHRAQVTHLLQDPAVLNEAILSSPTFRSFARYGFSSVCAGSAVVQVLPRQITVIANACRP